MLLVAFSILSQAICTLVGLCLRYTASDAYNLVWILQHPYVTCKQCRSAELQTLNCYKLFDLEMYSKNLIQVMGQSYFIVL